MKFNQKLLSIPPYISTSWDNITSLHVEQHETTLLLVITLLNGDRIEVPDLHPAIVETIFNLHAEALIGLEEQASVSTAKHPIDLAKNQEIFSFNFPLKGILPSAEQFGSILQHNPEQKNNPNLPEEILSRITQIAKTMGIDDVNAIPKPEPLCNCMHCQIANSLQKGFSENVTAQEETPEEIVSDEELKFRIWDICPAGEKLYIVSNPLDTQEHYNVFLGEPLGCTCGEKHCEHIKAVLNS